MHLGPIEDKTSFVDICGRILNVMGRPRFRISCQEMRGFGVKLSNSDFHTLHQSGEADNHQARSVKWTHKLLYNMSNNIQYPQ